MSILQPVHVKYGDQAADPGQDIAVSDPSGSGEATTVYFSQEIEDPKYHHGNSGAYSFVEGANSSTGFDAWGSISLWLADLWAPNPAERTEFQVWMALASTATGEVVSTFPHQEGYAPIQHDDIVWDASGALVRDAPGHNRCNAHVTHSFGPLFVPSNRRLRVQIAQFHTAPAMPDGRPWPGYIRKAWADLAAVPR